MNWLTAGLMFVNASVVCAVLLGIIGRGLQQSSAVAALVVGAIVATSSWLTTIDKPALDPRPGRYRNVTLFLLGAIFAIFAAR